MRRPPRNPRESMVGATQLILAGVQGLLLLAACIAFYTLALRSGQNTNAARTLAFVTLTAGNLMLVRVDMTRGQTVLRLLNSGNRMFWWIVVGACVVVSACILVPWLAHLFGFERMSLLALAFAAGIGVLAALSFDLLKLVPAVQRALGGREIGRLQD